jgi:hypothetical protein
VSWQDGRLKNIPESAVKRGNVMCLVHIHHARSLEDYYPVLIDELRINSEGSAGKQIGHSALRGQILFRSSINTATDSMDFRTKP